MKTIRLTMAQALVKWLCAQRTVVGGTEAPLVGGVFAIFGHGDTSLGEPFATPELHPRSNSVPLRN